MLLALDVGNTHITLGVFEGKKIKLVARLATDTKRTSDQYAIEIIDVIRYNKLDTTLFDASIIGSVVPVLNRTLDDAVQTAIGIKPLFVGPGVKTGLNIKIDDPAQLGADFACGAVAAIEHYSLPCAIVDLGTATKISVIDKNRSFLGGTITAGIGISMTALAQKTAQLPHISIEAPKKVIGTNTIDSMKSGIVLGTACMLDGLIARIEEELGETVTIISTGGFSSEIIPHCRREIIYDQNLILEGERLIFEKNRV